MTLHRVEFDYDITETGFMDIDMDPELNLDAYVNNEISNSFPEAFNIEIIKVEELK